MDEIVFRGLYKQFMFFSNNGAEIIENPSIAMSEACKCTGRSREDVREALRCFEENRLIERVGPTHIQYKMTALGADREKVEGLIARLTTL